MADFKFSCPHCGIGVECDELWSGHEIQCPSCQKQFTVPPKPAGGPPASSFATVKQGQTKLAISQASQAYAAQKPMAPQVAALEQKLAQAKAGRKSPVMKWVKIGIVVVGLGVGGYFGYGFFKQWQGKRAEAARLASAPPPVTNAAPAEPEPPPPPKELPLLPAVWTLDVEQARIPEGKANGSISGTNFVVETAVCTPQLLRLYQGAAISPDREIMVYLRLGPGESLTNRNWTIAKDMRGKGVPQVVKRWRPNPRYGAQSRTYSSGYALKLELGQATSNIISGKIFIALPDTEQSVVAGHFKAAAALPSASSAGGQNPVPPPAPAPPPDNPNSEKRYGKKR
jgi:hypothetical protein